MDSFIKMVDNVPPTSTLNTLLELLILLASPHHKGPETSSSCRQNRRHHIRLRAQHSISATESTPARKQLHCQLHTWHRWHSKCCTVKESAVLSYHCSPREMIHQLAGFCTAIAYWKRYCKRRSAYTALRGCMYTAYTAWSKEMRQSWQYLIQNLWCACGRCLESLRS